jgi:hypothetical protein
MVFFLFAVVHNVFNGKSPAIVYILLILMVIPATILYYYVFKQSTPDQNRLVTALKDEQIKDETAPETDIPIIEAVTEEEIDIKKLLPKEKSNPEKFGEELLQNLAGEFQITQGLFYIKSLTEETFNCFGQYAYYSDRQPVSFKLGETLPGQAVKNKNIVTLSDIPDNYMIIASGLGAGSPRYLTFVPLLSRDEVVGLIEFAAFMPVSETFEKTLKQLSQKIGETLTKMMKK